MLKCSYCGGTDLAPMARCRDCERELWIDLEHVDYEEGEDDLRPVVVSFPSGKSQRRWLKRGQCIERCEAIDGLGGDKDVKRWERKWVELAAAVLKVDLNTKGDDDG